MSFIMSELATQLVSQLVSHNCGRNCCEGMQSARPPASLALIDLDDECGPSCGESPWPGSRHVIGR